ncbi:MAG: hypothetical protein M1833_005593 [Piccolia ochrophora]|nr:MAG: hypothetical protein M1833_005593 [Piccolia ochrophora]
MSVHPEISMTSSPETPKRREHKSQEERKARKKEKKRKRQEEQDNEASPPAKRHQLDEPKDTATHEIAEGPFDSPFHLQTSSLCLSLSPISQHHPLDGICAEHLSPLLLTYYHPLRAIILSYSNVRLSERPPNSGSPHDERPLARSSEDSAASLVWVTADFVLFKPGRGDWIEGWVNLQDEGHLGLVCWNLFNASIERGRLPSDWTWTGVGGILAEEDEDAMNGLQNGDTRRGERGEGYYLDAAGSRIEGMIRFRVKDIETSFDHEKRFMSIEGTLLDEEVEKELMTQEVARHSRSGDRMKGVLERRPYRKTSRIPSVDGAEDAPETNGVGGSNHSVTY